MAMAIQATSPDFPHCPDVDPTGGWTVEPRFYQTLPGVVAGDVVRVKFMARLAPGSPPPIGSSIGSFALTVDSEGNLHYPQTNNTIGGSSLSANWSEIQGSVTVPAIPSGHVFALGFSGHTFGGGNGVIEFDNMAILVEGTGARLNAKVKLNGAAETGTNLMRDDLRVAGLFPTTLPANTTTMMGPYAPPGDNVSLDPSVLAVTGPNAIVDWAWIELRFGRPDNATVPADGYFQPYEAPVRRYVLVQRDGDIVDLDGVSTVALPIKAGNCYVVVKHRNHLGVMSARSLALSSTPLLFDTRAPSTLLFQLAFGYIGAPLEYVGSTLALWAGDAWTSGVHGAIRYTGTANDRDAILMALGGTMLTQTVIGYHRADTNLDGVVKYVGAGNDRDLILRNIGGSAPTAVRFEQLPY